MILHLHRFPIRHFHGAFQLVQCHHQLEPHPRSEFSLDVRAHRSAMLVSRLLRIVCNIGFFGFHFSAQIEIENVVFEVDWNELLSSIPIHQFLEMHPHFLTKFGGAAVS